MTAALVSLAVIGLLGVTAIPATLRELPRDGLRLIPTDPARARNAEERSTR